MIQIIVGCGPVKPIMRNISMPGGPNWLATVVLVGSSGSSIHVLDDHLFGKFTQNLLKCPRTTQRIWAV